MTERNKTELLPTLKVNPKKDDVNAVKFKDCQVTISEVTDLNTMHGDKIVVGVLLNDKKFNVFLNATSKNNLIDAYGNDDKNWINRICNLKKEVDNHYHNEMIVFHPVK